MINNAGFKIIAVRQYRGKQNLLKIAIKKTFELLGFGVGNFIEVLARK